MDGFNRRENKQGGPGISRMSSGIGKRRDQRVENNVDRRRRSEQLGKKISRNMMGPSPQLGDWGTDGSSAASAEMITPASAEMITPERVLIFNSFYETFLGGETLKFLNSYGNPNDLYKTIENESNEFIEFSSENMESINTRCCFQLLRFIFHNSFLRSSFSNEEIKQIYIEIIQHCRNKESINRFDNSRLERTDTGPFCKAESERLNIDLNVGRQLQNEYDRRDSFLDTNNACDPQSIENSRGQRCEFILEGISRKIKNDIGNINTLMTQQQVENPGELYADAVEYGEDQFKILGGLISIDLSEWREKTNQVMVGKELLIDFLTNGIKYMATIPITIFIGITRLTIRIPCLYILSLLDRGLSSSRSVIEDIFNKIPQKYGVRYVFRQVINYYTYWNISSGVLTPEFVRSNPQSEKERNTRHINCILSCISTTIHFKLMMLWNQGSLPDSSNLYTTNNLMVSLDSLNRDITTGNYAADGPLSKELILCGYLLDYGINRWKTGGNVVIPEETDTTTTITQSLPMGTTQTLDPSFRMTGGKRKKKKTKRKKYTKRRKNKKNKNLRSSKIKKLRSKKFK